MTVALMMFALVSSGCHNKTPWTEWLTQWELGFSLISEPEKSKIKVPADSVSGEFPLPGL